MLEKKFSEAHKSIQNMFTVIDFLPELDSKTPLLKIPHALVAEYREIILDLGWKVHPFWIAFRLLEITMQKSPSMLYSTG